MRVKNYDAIFALQTAIFDRAAHVQIAPKSCFQDAENLFFSGLRLLKYTVMD